MKLYFVNVECRVRKETRLIPADVAAAKPYRTFVYAVIAPTEREAVFAAEKVNPDVWYEVKRYAQNPEGYEPGTAVFQGATDHDRKLYMARECEEAA